jgi:hypothetical protein
VSERLGNTPEAAPPEGSALSTELRVQNVETKGEAEEESTAAPTPAATPFPECEHYEFFQWYGTVRS